MVIVAFVPAAVPASGNQLPAAVSPTAFVYNCQPWWSGAQVNCNVLPTGTARLLEMARALAAGPNVLLLDEASSGLDTQESERLGELMVELAQQEGMAVLLVEHDMDLVMRVCEYIYVLDFGEMIAAGKPSDIRSDPKVQAAYLGAATDETPQELLVTEEVGE